MKKMMKLLGITFLIAAMAATMAACGGNGGDAADSAEADGGQETGEKVVYKAVTEATYPPFDTVDEDGNIVGFDMDLLDAIAEDQGFAVEYTDMGFEALIPAVQAGNADIIAAAMTANDPERQALLDFVVYYESGAVLLSRADDDRITDMESLTPDMKVATQIGNTYVDVLNELEAEGKIAKAVVMDGFNMCVLQVLNGDADAALTGYDVAVEYMKTSDGKLKASDILMAEETGFAVNKGNDELREKIAAGLENVKASGKYDELVEKWLNTEN